MISTREKIWNIVKPEIPYSKVVWATGYAEHAGSLFAFANIGDVGRTGHDFPNQYNQQTGEMIWYGKPNAHSAQNTFRKLFDGIFKLVMFVRWDNKNPNWLFLGTPVIKKYDDNVQIEKDTTTIRLELKFNIVDWQDEKIGEGEYAHFGEEGIRKAVLVNKYERDPRLRAEAINVHGTACLVCGFDFGKTYGEFGEGFCHIHHLNPLGEVRSHHKVNPKTDLIPVCPNCHAMLHRKNPAIKPEELKKLMNKKNGAD